MEVGFGEIVCIAILLLVVYGRRLPEIMKAIGKGLSEVKRNLNELKQEVIHEAPDNSQNLYSRGTSGETDKDQLVSINQIASDNKPSTSEKPKVSLSEGKDLSG